MGTGGYVHASAVLVGERALLIEGPSGAGKSTLAAMLIEGAAREGQFAALIGDDRVEVRARGGRLIAAAHPAIAGRLEIRGLGIVPIRHVSSAVLWGLVSIGDGAARLPEEADRRIQRDGVFLRHLRLASTHDSALRMHLALAWLQA